MIDIDESCCNHSWKLSYTVTDGAIIYGNSRDFEDFQTDTKQRTVLFQIIDAGKPLISLILAAGNSSINNCKSE